MAILDIETSKEYIDYIREQRCLACGTTPVDPDHLKAVGMGRNRKNNIVEDFSCIPLCRKCHVERHQIGNIRFEAKHSVNLWKDAYNYLIRYITND